MGSREGDRPSAVGAIAGRDDGGVRRPLLQAADKMGRSMGMVQDDRRDHGPRAGCAAAGSAAGADAHGPSGANCGGDRPFLNEPLRVGGSSDVSCESTVHSVRPVVSPTSRPTPLAMAVGGCDVSCRK